MPTKEMVERIRKIVSQSTWSSGDIDVVWNEYKALGHKYPKSKNCRDCVISVMNFWRAYIKEYDQTNG